MSSVFQSISSFFVCAVLAVFAQNAIFSRSLGVSRLIKIVDDTANTVLFGCLICTVQVVAAPMGYLANNLLAGFAIRNALRPLVLVICSAIAYLLVRAVAARSQKLTNREEVLEMLPSATFNCAVLGAMLVSATQSYTLAQTIGFAFGTGFGYLLALLVVNEAQRKLRGREVPASFRGLPINLIYIGILAMAIYGFTGHMVAI